MLNTCMALGMIYRVAYYYRHSSTYRTSYAHPLAGLMWVMIDIVSARSTEKTRVVRLKQMCLIGNAHILTVSIVLGTRAAWQTQVGNVMYERVSAVGPVDYR